MDIFTGIILYFMIYSLTLFCVLPWGNRPLEDPETGHAASAPAKPRLKLKLLATAILSLAVWGGVQYLIHIQFFDFHEMAREMEEELEAQEKL